MTITNIQPISDVFILQNVPLDNSYTDTLTFVNEAEQLDFFKSKQKYHFEHLSPIGLGSKIRIPLPADTLYDCNYIVFQNGNFSAKHLFAFITGVEYVNPNVCYINFEIDVIQSWYFNMNIGECMVLREHVNDDSVGAHTEPENLPIQFYTYAKVGTSGFFKPDKFYIIVATNYTANAGRVIGDMLGGVFSGLKYYYFLPNQLEELSSFLETMTQISEDAVISIFMYPYEFYPDDNTAVEKKIGIPKSNYISEIDGYKPKNNKLLCYPYNMINISNGCGEERDLRIERWKNDADGDLIFSFYGTLSNNPAIIAFPKNYNGEEYGIKEIIEINNFPMCSWSCDTFRAYVAQNATSIASNIVNTVTKNPLALINTTSDLAKNIIAPEFKTYGSYNGNNVKFSSGVLDIKFQQKCISSEYAKIFDDELSRYGYSINRIKKPNITGRKSWNYVKTEKANITGTIPFTDSAKIKNIFNNGITFWHGDYIGDYSRDNSII